jgi:hypothetical protein
VTADTKTPILRQIQLRKSAVMVAERRGTIRDRLQTVCQSFWLSGEA